jgi:alkyl hydroperoxide reductase subunit AhpF
MTETRDYDIVILGGGPAGLAAGLYGARGRHKTLLIEKGVIGGQISTTEMVENYPGIPQVNGFDLAQTMLQQSESYGMEPSTPRSARSRSRARSGSSTPKPARSPPAPSSSPPVRTTTASAFPVRTASSARA